MRGELSIYPPVAGGSGALAVIYVAKPPFAAATRSRWSIVHHRAPARNPRVGAQPRVRPRPRVRRALP